MTPFDRVSPLTLASRSPQRRAILEQLGVAFTVVTPDYVEDDALAVPAQELVVTHAIGKARAVEGLHVLGVDTTVAIDGLSLGKPGDADEAEQMLRRLAGRTHVVHSGLCLRVGATEHVRTCTTRVAIRELEDDEIGWYLETGEWRERAGSYAIQGFGAALVAGIDGDYTNVVGLPVTALIDAVREVSPPVGC